MANEKRLIDANALWTALDEAGLFASGNPRHIAQQTVEEQPTVDAVEVVRCNKCTYWDKAKSNKKGFLICPASGMEIKADDFCSYGERREA